MCINPSLKWKILIPLVAVLCALPLGGCYTQLMTYRGETLAARDSADNNGDCGECLDVTPSSDRREVCVWERDILGFPELRCYTTNYYSSWIYFHNTPWWYRSSYGWYDTRGCPPYYYYDRVFGTCRYYSGPVYPTRPGVGHGSGGGGIAVKPEQQAPTRRNSRIVSPPVAEPSAAPADVAPTPSSPMFSGGIKSISPASSPIKIPPPSATETPSNQTMSKPQEASGQTPPPPPPPQQQPPSQPTPREETPQNPPPRRNPRGM